MSNPPSTWQQAVSTLGTFITGAMAASFVVGWLLTPTDKPDNPPAPVVAAAPESWIVLDAQGVRVVDSTVEKIAGSLKPGRWTAQGIPKPGEKGVSLTITVDDGVVPVPPQPPPDPPKPPEPPQPPPVVEGKRQVLIIRESTRDTAEFSRLLVAVRTGASRTYLESKGHKLYLLDDNDKDMNNNPTPLVEKWRPHYAGMALPAVFILDDKGELLHKQGIDPKASDPAIVLDVLKTHGG